MFRPYNSNSKSKSDAFSMWAPRADLEILNLLISGRQRIDLHRPSINSTREIEDILETLL